MSLHDTLKAMQEENDPNRVIAFRNLPARLPIYQTIVVLLALDYWNAPEWLYGVLGVVFLFIWSISIHGIYKQKQTDIFQKTKKQ